MLEYLNELKKEIGNEYASAVIEGVSSGDVNDFVDTGSYLLNALLSGSIYGGMPSNKITAIAGEEATGKTFFALGICKEFLDKNPEGAVLYFESESAISKQMVESRNVDSSRIIIFPVTTIQEFRTQALKVVDIHLARPKNDRPPLLLVLDSLGMLSTTKEVEDTSTGAETKDMTRAQLVKAAFRVLTLKLGRANIPLIVTNHTYSSMGSMYPTKEMSGGSGLKYAASNILFLSKRKEKDGNNDVIGNIIHCLNNKSRLTKENKMIDVKLTYEEGLDRHYGLLDIAEKYGIIKKVSTRYEMPDGTKYFGKAIYSEPEKHFTPDLLDKIDEVCKREFLYGKTEDVQETEDDITQPENL